MIRNKLKILFIYLLLITMAVACSKGGNTAEISSTEKSTMAKASTSSGSNNISIYISRGDSVALGAVSEFNSKNADRNITVNEFDYSSQIDDTRNKITKELMVGEGPDIIYVSNDRMFPSISKIIESGVFCDLNSFIEKDKEFKFSDYNKVVLDSGVINGKRFIIPLSYTIPSLWTTKNMFDNNNIHLDSSKWTWKDFFGEAKKYKADHEGEDKYFVGFPYGDPQYIIEDICGELVDYENRRTNFDSEEFIEFLEAYKEISDSICPGSEITTLKDLSNYIKKDSIVTISTDGYISPYHMYGLNSVLKEKLGKELVLLKNPLLSENSPKSAYPVRMVGINSNSRSKEKAFEFIKLLLSDSYQSSEQLSSISVNINGYANGIDKYTADDFIRDSEMYLDTVIDHPTPLPSKVVGNMNEIISGINKCKFLDRNIVEIVAGEVAEYLRTGRSAQAAAKEIDNKVMLYLNE